jgi:3-oxoacyl-[acyl-carrier protein] reductase
MELGLRHRRAAVAAGSSGLGLGVVRALASEGVRVAFCGRDRGRLESAAASVDAETIPIVADLSTPRGATGFFTAADEALGGIDILVCNAGGPPAGTFASTPLAAYQPALELNLLATVAMCEAAVPAMRAQQWGRVLAITSATVREPAGNLILSNVARAGATAFAKTLAREVAADGVTVNTLQPGLHDTPRLDELGATDRGRLAAVIPARRLGDPDDFGRVAAFLCSDSARFVTGVSIPIDGGTFSGLQ